MSEARSPLSDVGGPHRGGRASFAISDGDVERIAAAVLRKMAEAELDRLAGELAFEERLEAYEAERRRLARAKRRRRMRIVKLVTVPLLAAVYLLMMEAL